MPRPRTVIVGAGIVGLTTAYFLARAGREVIGENQADVQELAPDNMLQALVQWRERNPGSVVVVKGDRDAPFGAMSDLMDTLAKSRTLRFNLMTDLRREGNEPGPGGARSREGGR